jgi:hypothetical protein
MLGDGVRLPWPVVVSGWTAAVSVRLLAAWKAIPASATKIAATTAAAHARCLPDGR